MLRTEEASHDDDDKMVDPGLDPTEDDEDGEEQPIWEERKGTPFGKKWGCEGDTQRNGTSFCELQRSKCTGESV